jgi:hypothetical protein
MNILENENIGQFGGMWLGVGRNQSLCMKRGSLIWDVAQAFKNQTLSPLIGDLRCYHNIGK